MTNPAGIQFFSYRRSRLHEAKMVIAAQKEHGIPTWQDVNDLVHEPTEEELRRVLGENAISGAVLWITPDVPSSAVMTKVEIPLLQQRHRRGDSFFIVPVAAGGLTYAQAIKSAESSLTADELSAWNIHRVDGNPINENEAAVIAQRVLRQRLVALHRHKPSGESLKLGLFCRAAAPKEGFAGELAIDWAHHYSGLSSDASIWENRLLPVLSEVARQIRAHAPGRAIEAFGLPSLPAALALGAAFPATSGLTLTWRQETVGQDSQVWDLNSAAEPTPLTARTAALNTDADELAVMISVTGNTEPAFAMSRPTLPRFRALISIQNEAATPYKIASSGQAADIATKTNAAIRIARDKYGPCKAIHLFTAMPAGLAVLLGRMLNAVGPVQLYQHIPSDTVGRYVPVARLNASMS